MFTKFLRNLSVFPIVVGLGYSSIALAEEDENIEEVIVTGSYIARAVEEQSNPVDMFDRSEWEEQGSPQMIEIISLNILCRKNYDKGVSNMLVAGVPQIK